MSAYDPKRTLMKPGLLTEIKCQNGRFRFFRVICSSCWRDLMFLRWLRSAQLDSTDFPPICHHLHQSPRSEPSLSRFLVERLN